MGNSYLVINGQKIELTDEQKKQLGIIEEKKSYFDRVPYGEAYYSIKSNGGIGCYIDVNDNVDCDMYAIANYCADKNLMEQRTLHETLNRLLWRYSMAHDGDKINWNGCISKYAIYYNYSFKRFDTWEMIYNKTENVVYFYSKEVAFKAIEEIVKPFMEEHPEFVW